MHISSFVFGYLLVDGLWERLVGLVYIMHRLEAYFPIIFLFFCVHGIDGSTSLDVMLSQSSY